MDRWYRDLRRAAPRAGPRPPLRLALGRPTHGGRADGRQHAHARDALRADAARHRPHPSPRRARRHAALPRRLHDRDGGWARPPSLRQADPVSARLKNLSTGRKVALGGLVLLALMVLIGATVGKQPKNSDYKPQNEFKLDPWIHLKIGSLDMSINKAVLYLLL